MDNLRLKERAIKDFIEFILIEAQTFNIVKYHTKQRTLEQATRLLIEIFESDV